MIDTGDTAWIMTSTALVLFMSLPGLALFYGGLVRSGNVLSALMHVYAVGCLMSLLWLAGVYSLAFSEGSDIIGGLGKAFLLNADAGKAVDGTKIPESVFFIQVTPRAPSTSCFQTHNSCIFGFFVALRVCKSMQIRPFVRSGAAL